MKIPGPFLLLALLVGTPVSGTNGAIVPTDNNASFNTKRVWVNVNNPEFIKDECHYEIDCKESEFSKETTSKTLLSVKNWNQGTYYYVDISVDINVFRIRAVGSNGITFKSTKWRYELFQTRLYQIYEGSDTIRYRNADVYPPDAYILAMVLSAYYSYSSSYENGYSAYAEIKTSWLDLYSGNTRGTLEETFFYDYQASDFVDKKPDTKRTRLISVKNKIEELSSMYNKSPKEAPIVASKIRIVGLVFLIASLALSIGAWIFLLGPKITKKI